jgi:glycosyltransferase involved in cell wall biosynthesis
MTILQQPDLAARLRVRGIERAALFSWERTADAYADLYAQVLRNSIETDARH